MPPLAKSDNENQENTASVDEQMEEGSNNEEESASGEEEPSTEDEEASTKEERSIPANVTTSGYEDDGFATSFEDDEFASSFEDDVGSEDDAKEVEEEIKSVSSGITGILKMIENTQNSLRSATEEGERVLSATGSRSKKRGLDLLDDDATVTGPPLLLTNGNNGNDGEGTSTVEDESDNESAFKPKLKRPCTQN